MSLEFNADKQYLKGTTPYVVGTSEFTVRSGSGTSEKEVMRWQLDATQQLARVGINRNGQQVEKITVTNNGSGYTVAPNVTISAPNLATGVQATASAVINAGIVVTILIDNPGSGYTSAPTVTISGTGANAQATATLNTIEYELDVNGAIRTSTSIISDTARVINLDFVNLTTADGDFRAPYLKLYANNTGTSWTASTIVSKDTFKYFGDNIYRVKINGTTGTVPPTHTDDSVANGTTILEHVGYRVNSASLPHYGTTGDGLFPRSITPLQGDRSNKIATTEYVLNLATNDVGGRVYVSEQIGSDLNDGRSAVSPVRTIKKACQIATATVGVKETVIIAGGDYIEDNPISLPPDCSIVGDSLRIVNVRPKNPGKHMFKFADKNYITGITFRDRVDEFGASLYTWDFACVFDDKQRIYYDPASGGDYGRDFPIGYQIQGKQTYRITFQDNTGDNQFAVGETIYGESNGANATVTNFSYTTTTGVDAYNTGYIDVVPNTNSAALNTGDKFRYGGPAPTLGTFTVPWVANTSYGSGVYLWVDGGATSGRVYVTTGPITTGSSAPSHTSGTVSGLTYVRDRYQITSLTIKSIRAEGEVVSTGPSSSVVPLSITRIDASTATYNTYGGIVIYTNALVGRSNTHDFKENEEVEISGLPTSSPDLSWLNGKQRVYKIIEDADSRSRRIVIPKQGSRVGFTQSNYVPLAATVKSASYYITVSLLNSPFKFPLTDYVSRRYQDACNLIRNNIEFIKDETYQTIADEFSPNFYIISIKPTSGTGSDVGKVILEIQSNGNHGFYLNDEVTLANISSSFGGGVFNGNYTVTSRVSATVFQVKYTGTLPVGLTSGNTYTAASSPSIGLTLAASNSVSQFTFAGTAVAGSASYTSIGQSATSGSGSGASFNVTRAGGSYTIVTVNNGGNGYRPGDTITIPGASLGGTSANNITVTVASINRPQTVQRAFVIPNETKCRRDIGHFVNAIIMDLEYGGNYHVVEAAKRYRSNSTLGYVGNELAYTVRALDVARQLCLYAMRNWNLNNGLYTQLDYIPAYSSVSRYVDGTVTEDTGLAGGATCSDVASSITTLAYLYADVLCNKQNPNSPTIGTKEDAGYSIMLNADFIASEALGYAKSTYPGLGLTADQERKCKRDIRYILSGLTRDLIAGGNSGIVTAAESYFTGNTLTGIPSAELTATRAAFVKVRDLAILAMRNWKTGTNGTGADYTPVYETVIPLQKNYGPVGNVAATIAVDPAASKCASIVTAITTEMQLLDDILAGNILPGATSKTYGTLYDPTITYPDGAIVDNDGYYITPRGRWDDLPFIEGSPYIQNASVISFKGGGGCEIDGSKIKQPNCPFPGLEQDGTATYPNQGKSMVAAQFTIVSFGGTGYKVNNDGYTQLVSVFVLFCTDGVLAESGGYASITNAATNFGKYALRAVGYRKDPYSFDVGTITNVSETATGRTIFTVSGLGRKPLEHYIVKIDGYTNQSTTTEYYIEKVGVTTGAPIYTSTFEMNAGLLLKRTSDGTLFNSPLSGAEFVGKTLRMHRPSIVNSSGHTWEFAGAGTDYRALPENGGIKIEAYEQVSENYGRVYTSGTDELGDFKVGYFAKIENRTGNITFTGTVSISEVEFLKLKGGDVVVTGFSADNTLGGATSSNSLLPTQKAVKDYITTNLGTYINKPYSTNAVPRALVELTDSGKISIDQIPALRPFSVYTVADQAARLALEGALAGDIAIQQDTSVSYILNNDLTSLYLGFAVNTALQFSLGSLYVGSPGGGQIQSTEYRQGIVYQINITNAGSGYTVAPTVTFTSPQQGGGILAAATASIANGQVTKITLISFSGLIGGRGYTSAPTVTLSAPGGAGTTATATCLIESRLYGTITNNVKILDTDTINSTNPTPVVVDVTRVVNTSATTPSNWVSLSSNQVSADQITSGVLSAARLAQNSTAANSYTFLRGDQSFQYAVQSLRGVETRYFVKNSQQTSSGGQQLYFTDSGAATILKGHSISTNTSGIAPNTTVSSVTLNAGLYTVNINNPVTSNIPPGSVIEFVRPASPLIIDTPITTNNYISSVIIASSGVGFTNGTYTGVTIQGGTGTGCKVDIIVSGNTITSVTVVDGGSGYTGDFTVTGYSTSLGAGGSGLVLQAKINTVLKYHANLTLDVARVADSATDEYSSVGVVRVLKSQFAINEAGNGSLRLKTGVGSGLDADLLDGESSLYYRTGTNFVDASIIPSKLASGTYAIDISGQSLSCLRLTTSDAQSSDPLPATFASGVISDTRNNTANSLSDGGTKNLVLTLKNGLDASYGGARQLAFTDNNNMWLRGSGSTLAQWSNWYKIWHSGNDASAGQGSGPDAYRLSNKLEQFYRTAYNVNYGVLSDNRVPSYQSSKSFDDSIVVRFQKNAITWNFYIPGVILSGGSGTYQVGSRLKLFTSSGLENGQVDVLSVTNYTSTDSSLQYTIIKASKFSGDVVVGGTLAVKIGADLSNSSFFTDYTIDTNNTISVASLSSTSGTALLKLGRTDGIASSPAVYFSSSTLAASNYNVALIASGGNATDGSGSLNIIAGSVDNVTINSNKIWNAGNVTFNSGFSGANYNTGANSVAVIRDSNGNAAFNAITLGATGQGVLTGSASLNVLKAGDTMTGSLTISGASSNLSVGGTSTFNGAVTVAAGVNLTVDTNTLFVDAANDRVGIKTTSPSAAFEINNGAATISDGTPDNAYNGLVRITRSTSNNQYINLIRSGQYPWSIGTLNASNTFAIGAGQATDANFTAANGSARLAIATSGEVGINTVPTSGIALDVNGTFRAKTSITISDATSNAGAPLLLLGSSTNRNFRISNELTGSDLFTIVSSTAAGGSTWNTTPALAIQGANQYVGLGTTTFSSSATGSTVNYRLNVEGNININGNVYQNNQPFVTSRWTQSTNGTDIHRLSKVGINKADPSYTLHVGGSVNIEGVSFGSTTAGASNNQNNSVLYANGDKMYIDSYAVFRTNRNSIAENVTIPTNTNAHTAGPITINNGYTVTIQNGAAWSIT